MKVVNSLFFRIEMMYHAALVEDKIKQAQLFRMLGRCTHKSGGFKLMQLCYYLLNHIVTSPLVPDEVRGSTGIAHLNKMMGNCWEGIG